MAYQSIGIGTTADDGTGDSLRIGADKVNDNFVELYTLLGDGSALSSGLSASATVISFGNENLTTTGTLAAGDITVGNIISTGSSIVLEGSTPNGNETTLTVTDPTGDRTITFPDATGTVLTSGDSNTVTGTIIAADTVAEANMADDAISSVQLKTLSTLLIKNSGGSTLKTIHGAGA